MKTLAFYRNNKVDLSFLLQKIKILMINVINVSATFKKKLILIIKYHYEEAEQIVMTIYNQYIAHAI